LLESNSPLTATLIMYTSYKYLQRNWKLRNFTKEFIHLKMPETGRKNNKYNTVFDL
jgi:hypothetical protein